jgi:hypothetical protein
LRQQPFRALGHCPRALLKAMSAVLKLGPFIEPRSGVFASFVTVDLGGNYNVAEFNVFDTARDADEQRHVCLEVTNCAIRYRGNPDVAWAHFDDCNVPTFKRADIENGALHDFLVPVTQ